MMPRPMNPTFAMFLPPCGSIGFWRSDAVSSAPAQSVDRLSFRLVLAADPALVADRIDEAEQEAIVDLAGAWLVAPWIVGELQMRNLRQMRLDRIRELAFHPLHMIDIVLQVQIVRADVADHIERLSRARQPETRNVIRVDGLDQQLDTSRSKFFGRKAQIRHEGAADCFRSHPRP